MTVVSLYVYDVLQFVHNNKSLFPVTSSLHQHNTRQCLNINLDVEHHIREKIKLYNSLPEVVRGLSKNKFKNTIKLFLTTNAMYQLNEFKEIVQNIGQIVKNDKN